MAVALVAVEIECCGPEVRMSDPTDRLRELVGRVLGLTKGTKAHAQALEALGRLLLGEYRPRMIRTESASCGLCRTARPTPRTWPRRPSNR